MHALRRKITLLAALAAGVLASTAGRGWASSRAPSSAVLLPALLPSGAPMGQIHAAGPTGLLGIATDGGLWALSSSAGGPRRLASGLDPATPLASGHGRLAGRRRDGALWVLDLASGQSQTLDDAGLAPHAGLLILPLAVLGVVQAGHRLVRFEASEPGGSGRGWKAVAQASEPLLPDARPVLADLDGRGDGGHIVVLAGPDAQRYRHGVLGDAIEGTRLLWLERHGLEVLRSLELPAPHVFEDIAPRPVVRMGRDGPVGLMTVRAGPEGGQLAWVSADPANPRALQLEALGEPVGGFHRWLAPTTDGRQLVAVHTPHIGGVLHVYQVEGPQLARRQVATDVSTHSIGSRETDLAIWLQGRLLLPSQNGRSLRVFHPARDWADEGALTLPARVVQTVSRADPPAWAGLLADGRVLLASLSP